jgi:hypothetical protein
VDPQFHVFGQYSLSDYTKHAIGHSMFLSPGNKKVKSYYFAECTGETPRHWGNPRREGKTQVQSKLVRLHDFGEEYGEAVKFVEDITTLFHYVRNAQTSGDVAIAASSFVRSIFDRSALFLAKDMVEIFVSGIADLRMIQSGESWVDRMDDFYLNYSSSCKSLVGQKLAKVFNHIIAHSFYHRAGIKFDEKLFERFEKEEIVPTLSQYHSFVDALMQLIVLLAKQGRQCMLSGSISPMFFDGTSCAKWLTNAKKLKANFEFLNNPEPAGFSIFSFLEDLHTCQLEGKTLEKMMDRKSVEYRLVVGLNIELDTLHKRFLCVQSAQCLRRQPLGIVLYGTPGVGKSSVLECLYHFYCAKRNLPQQPGWKYQFSSEEEFMTNFSTRMHTIVVDDAAQHAASKVQGIDLSLSLLIKLLNNQPFCPPQASLDDKGKTPVLSELVFVTSNVVDLNIPYFFSSPFAVMRRLPIHIEPVVKEMYRKTGGEGIDSAKADLPDTFPDYWDFIVRTPVQGEGTRMGGTYKITDRFHSYRELFEWLGPLIDRHNADQDNFLAQQDRFIGTIICEKCGMPIQLCACDDASTEETQVRIFRQEESKSDPCDEAQSADSESDGEEPFSGVCPDWFQPERTHDMPWRTTVPTGPPRFYNSAVSRRFARSAKALFRHGMTEDDKYIVDFYCYGPLPLALVSGFTNRELAVDFEQYYEWAKDDVETRQVIQFEKTFCEKDSALAEKDSVTILDSIFAFLLYLYFNWALARVGFRFAAKSSWVRSSVKALFRKSIIKTRNQEMIFEGIGAAIDMKYGGKLPFIRIAIAFFGSVAAIVLLKQVVMRFLEPPIGGRIQMSNRLRTVGHHPRAEKTERENVWNAKERSVTSVDFLPKRATNMDALQKSLLRNCLIMIIHGEDEGGKYNLEGRVIVLNSTCFITNNHTIPKGRTCQATIYYGTVLDKGVHPLIDFTIGESMVTRDVLRDIAFVRTEALPVVFSNISKNFVKETFDGVYDGFYLIRQLDGTFKKIPVYRVRKMFIDRQVGGHKFQMECYAGIVGSARTVYGDCGAPLVLDTGYGPVIVGFHFMLDEDKGMVYATRVPYEDVESYLLKDQIQCGVVNTDGVELIESNKSYVVWHKGGSLLYHGETTEFRRRPKTLVFHTELHEQLLDSEYNDLLPFGDNFTAPNMRGWKSQQLSLCEYLQPIQWMDEERLNRISEAIFVHLRKAVPEDQWEQCHTYGLDVAVNGFPGVKYVDGIKRSTSMGFPIRGPKRPHLIQLEDETWKDGVRFTDDLEEKIELAYEKLTKGERVHPVFDANLKDEPVSYKKFESGKTRVFFSCPYDFLIIVRMLFGGFCRVVQNNRMPFWCSVGLNCHSSEWDDLYQFLAKLGLERCIAGDYTFFDKKIPVVVGRKVMSLIIRLCEATGNYSEEELTAMRTIATEMTSATVDYFGMFITLLGGEVSGHQLTTIFNCFVNLIYLMYAWEEVGFDVDEFFDRTVGTTYGDDHVVCVAEGYEAYNHTAIQEVFENLGLGYTMAEKEQESVPFIRLTDATFLKRRFVWNKTLGKMCAPLDKKSIAKMLMIQVGSKTCARSEQLAQAIVSASMEAFYHGRETFDYVNESIDLCDKSPELLAHMRYFERPTWDENVERFWAASQECQDEALDKGLNQNVPSESSYCSADERPSKAAESVEIQRKLTWAIPEIRIYGRDRLVLEMKDTVVELERAPPPDNIPAF